MRIYKIVQRELSETEEKTIQHFRYYYDNKKCFAVIGDYVVAVLSDEYANQPENLEQEARENMVQLRNTPPDFSTYVMDDGYGLVEMNYGIYAVSSRPLSDKEIEEGKVSLGTALAVRGFCLAACEKGQVIAINDMGC